MTMPVYTNTPSNLFVKIGFRKMMPTRVDQVKVNSENGCFEGPHEDGYSWRKYGQKDILGAKCPRC